MSNQASLLPALPDTLRAVVGNVFLAIVIVLLVDVVVVMLYRIGAVVLKVDYIKVFCFELGLCVAMLICALDLRFNVVALLPQGAARVAGYVVRALAVACTVVVLFLGGRIAAGGCVQTSGSAQYAIVLGMALEHDEPSKDLLLRLKTAKTYLDQNPQATLVLTGGNPSASGATEAQVMRSILLKDGVPATSIVLEDKATSTKENFANVARIVDPVQPVVLISSDYHMDRATRIAQTAGFVDVMRLPAPRASCRKSHLP